MRKRMWMLAAGFFVLVIIHGVFHWWMEPIFVAKGSHFGGMPDMVADTLLFGLFCLYAFWFYRRSERKRDKYQTLLNASESMAGTGAWTYDVRGKSFHATAGLWQIIEKESDPLHSIEACLSMVDVSDRERIGSAIKKALHTSSGWQLQYGITTFKGHRKRIESKGKVLKIGGNHFLVATIFDITVTTEQQRRVHFFNALVNHSYESVLLTDTERRIFYVNEAFCKMTGYTKAEVIGQTPHALKSSGHQDAAFYERLWESIERKHHWEGELLNRKKSGEVYRERIVISAVYHDEALLGYGAVSSEIASRNKTLEHYLHIGEYDPLTGLLGRFAFMERLDTTIVSQSSAQQLALLLLDIDNFKKVNDGLGLMSGDRVLQLIADRLQSLCEDAVAVGHIGGDEFGILYTDLDDEALHLKSVQIQELFAVPFGIADTMVYLSCSIGIALYPYDAADADAILRKADIALQQAKHAGKGSTLFYSAQIEGNAPQMLALEHQLHEGIERNEFFLQYQPKVSLIDGEITGFEALARWKNSEGESIPPGRFIPMAEASDLIITISEQLYAQAFAFADALAAAEPDRDFHVALNLAARQLGKPAQLLTLLENLFERYPKAAHHIELELIERMLLESNQELLNVMQTCKTMGIMFAIDDFGTGYSSLSYLKKFPVDKLKIDQSFVKGVLKDDKDRQIVSTIIQMAETLGFTTIAEGAETEAEVRFLQRHGCAVAQGYYFSKPVEPNRATELFLLQPFKDDTVFFGDYTI